MHLRFVVKWVCKVTSQKLPKTSRSIACPYSRVAKFESSLSAFPPEAKRHSGCNYENQGVHIRRTMSIINASVIHLRLSNRLRFFTHVI